MRVDNIDRLESLAAHVRASLAASGATVAVAESTCGGLVSNALGDADEPRWLRVGLILYANDAKRELVGVPDEALAAGAVSPALALAMARGARARFGATWGIAESGIAGPRGSRRSRKPVGSAVLAVVGGPGERPLEIARALDTDLDDRVANKRAFAVALLALFEEALVGAPSPDDSRSGQEATLGRRDPHPSPLPASPFRTAPRERGLA